MRIEPHDYHAVAAVAARRRERGRRARAHRMPGRAGCRASPPSRRRRARSSSGTAWIASCTELRHFLDRNQITFRWITPDAPDAAEHWGGPLPPATTARRSASSTARRSCGRSCAGWPSCSASPPSRPPREYDTVIVGAGPGRARRGRLRRVGGAAHDRGRAGGARRPGRHLVADRELPRLPVRRLGRRAREPRAAAGAAARRRDPRHPDDHADRRRRPASVAPRRRRRPPGAHDHPRLRRRVAAPRRSRASTGSPGRASPTAPRAARRRTRTASTSTSSARATRPGRRRSSSPRTRAA